ncbi:MAG: HAMP domain-containing histidine kinase, partial [Chloroflexi bacterium]|nr:HAMP domain-containing histidine kinase [Chloroflexota bacterium]
MLGIDPASRASAPTALASAALRLVGEGVTARALIDRFAAEGAGIDETVAEGILGELAMLGLVRVARADGSGRVHVLTSLGRQFTDAGAVIGAGIATQLADLEHLRTDLLSTIAHELRTPLTAVRTCVGILRDPTTTPTEAESAKLLATIERNADRMQQVVGDILEIARFRTGEVVLQLRGFDAVELARGAIASVEPLATARSQAIVLAAPSAAIRVFGDRRRLEQALINLVSNAVKYGHAHGRIDVSVRPHGGWVTWTVRDEGPGIAEEDRPHLFERFFVGPNDRDGASRGVGLGLPTALAIAQAHGGRIDV